MSNYTKKNIPFISTLKGIGALGIIVYHGIAMFGVDFSSNIMNEMVHFISNVGFVPVEMFFFLSGFLMIYNYKDKIADTSVEEYFSSKFRRIMPYIIINVTLCTIYLIFIKKQFSTYQVIYNILFMQCGVFKGQGDYRIDIAGGGLWFIAPLFLGYLLFFYICKYKNEEKAFILYLTLTMLGIIGLSSEWNQPIFNGYTLRGITAFFSGCLYYFVQNNKSNKEKKIIISLIGIVTYAIILYRHEYTSVINFIIVTDIVALPSIVTIINEVSIIKKIFEYKSVPKFGKYSIAMFALNLPIGYFTLKLMSNTEISKNIQFVIYFALILLFSICVTYVVNKFVLEKVRKYNGKNYS